MTSRIFSFSSGVFLMVWFFRGWIFVLTSGFYLANKPVVYQGVINECQDKRKKRFGQVIEGCAKMVGWKAGEGGPRGGQ